MLSKNDVSLVPQPSLYTITKSIKQAPIKFFERYWQRYLVQKKKDCIYALFHNILINTYTNKHIYLHKQEIFYILDFQV